jgi:hypothetical protein
MTTFTSTPVVVVVRRALSLSTAVMGVAMRNAAEGMGGGGGAIGPNNKGKGGRGAEHPGFGKGTEHHALHIYNICALG